MRSDESDLMQGAVAHYCDDIRGMAGTLPAPPEWTGGYAALCGTCQRPLMTDEAPAGLCERCALANTARRLLEVHDG